MPRLLHALHCSAAWLSRHWLALGLLIAALIPAQWSEQGPVICPHRLLTEQPCPGCGMIRACGYALHGEFERAVGFNAAVTIVLPLLIVLALKRSLGRTLAFSRPAA